MAERRAPVIWSVRQRAPGPEVRTAELCHAFGAGGVLAPVGPGEWLLLSAEAPGEEALRASLGEAPVIFDLTHARCIIALDGPRAIELIGQGCPLSVHGWGRGRAASTVLGHFSVVLIRTDTGFQVVFDRSYARSGREWLVHVGTTRGVTEGGPRAWSAAEIV